MKFRVSGREVNDKHVKRKCAGRKHGVTGEGKGEESRFEQGSELRFEMLGKPGDMLVSGSTTPALTLREAPYERPDHHRGRFRGRFKGREQRLNR